MKLFKKVVLISMICLVAIIITFISTNEIRVKKRHENLMEERLLFVKDVMDEKYEIGRFGCIELPEGKKELSLTGECVFLKYKNEYYVYFFNSYTSMLGSARGVLCVCKNVGDNIKGKASETWEFVRMIQIDENFFDASAEL